MKAVKRVLITLGFLSGALALTLHFYNPTREREWRLERVRENRSATVHIANVSPQGEVSFGSGAAISRYGTVLTVSHVAEGGTLFMLEQERNGQIKTYNAVLAASDKRSQLAVLFTSKQFSAAVVFGEHSAVREGDLLYTIGFPGTFQRPMVNAGIVSSRFYHVPTGYPRHSTLVHFVSVPGMSGSPVFNQDGELVGLFNALLYQRTIGAIPPNMGTDAERWAGIISTDPLAQILRKLVETTSPLSTPTMAR